MEKFNSSNTAPDGSDPIQQDIAEPGQTKRSRLSKIGLAAATLIGSSAMYPSIAMAQPSMMGPGGLPGSNPRPELRVNQFEQLRQLNANQLRELTITTRLPMSTPITRMGLDEAAVAKLTPAARSLTKADLEALGQGNVTGKLKKLTVQDINSIKIAFRGGYNPSVAGVDVSCCCCTPCCCAAAVT